MTRNRRVVVTGLGLVTCLGLHIEENWGKLCDGVSGIGGLSLEGGEASPVRVVGAVKAADYRRIEKELRAYSSEEGERRTLFALWAAKCALSDAGYLNPLGTGFDSGVFLAAGLGINRLEDIHRWVDSAGKFDFVRFGQEYRGVCGESLVRNPSNRPSALISMEFGLHGSNCTVSSACASATQAIGLAFREIRRGDSDMVVAGGADSMINPVGLVSFALLDAASVSSERPASVSRPFDRKRSGLVIGEGAGIVVLEDFARALSRGAKIYAEVAGYGSSMDAYRVAAPHPKGLGAEQAMRHALRDADLNKDDIDYINAHGTGTKLNDLAETMAIKNVFQEFAGQIPISSSKSMIGHLMAASGGPEFIYTVLSTQRDEIHPTINLHHPDPKCDLDYVPNVKRSKTVRAALSNSFGFGGQNASIIVKKYVT